MRINEGTKSRPEKPLPNGRKYQKRSKQIKTVKKEKYKGNKYIMSMEQETEKRRHERIGDIKSDKKRVKKQKSQRDTSKVQKILKRKESQKNALSKKNEENALKELERIKAAKSKSLRTNRVRSNSEHQSVSDRPYKSKRKAVSNTPVINKVNRSRTTAM